MSRLSKTRKGRSGWRTNGMIWALFLPVLIGGLVLLTIAGRQVVQHVGTLAWEPVPAELLARGQEESPYTTASTRRPGNQRITGRYAYHWQGKRHEGTQVALSTVYSRSIGWTDDWETRLSRHLGEPGQSLQVWVNPQAPDKSVAFRDLRWAELGVEVGFGLMLTLIGWLFLSGWNQDAKAAGFSWRVVATMAIVGSCLAVLTPLLWRDGHPVWAVIAAVPLLLAVNGTIAGLRQKLAGAGADGA
jgi:hypothetical protein